MQPHGYFLTVNESCALIYSIRSIFLSKCHASFLPFFLGFYVIITYLVDILFLLTRTCYLNILALAAFTPSIQQLVQHSIHIIPHSPFNDHSPLPSTPLQHTIVTTLNRLEYPFVPVFPGVGPLRGQMFEFKRKRGYRYYTSLTKLTSSPTKVPSRLR